MYRSLICGVVAGALGLADVVAVAGHPSCRAKLTLSDVQFSRMIPPAWERTWTATVMVDASRCAPNASGTFDLGISRQAETGYQLDFRERFMWLAPAVKIGLDFGGDEAVEQYWIENVTPCRCAD